MNKYRHSKAGLFLMEIMLNILFFSVLATICLQLFFKAHTLSESTTTLHRAVTTSTSIAEVYQSSNNGKEALLSIYNEAVSDGEQIIIYFDESFLACSNEKSIYQAVVTLEDNNLRTAQIEFGKKGLEPIYILSASSYESLTPSSLSGGGAHE